MRTLRIEVSDRPYARISALARRKGLPRSEIVRRALYTHLSAGGHATEGSFLELAHDLAGCVSGPPGLSVARPALGRKP